MGLPPAPARGPLTIRSALPLLLLALLFAPSLASAQGQGVCAILGARMALAGPSTGPPLSTVTGPGAPISTGSSAPAGAEPLPLPPATVPRLPPERAAPAVRWHRTGTDCPVDPTGQTTNPRLPSPGRLFVYSGLLPGTGQRILGQRRWMAYAVLEVAGWAYFWDRRRTGAELRDEYRDLAWFVARRGFGEERVDGDFEYYENVSRFEASGAFDADPFLPGIQPEPDSATFNGSVWALAQEIFLPPDTEPVPGSPEFERALTYYRERSVGPELLWDWGGAAEDRAAFDRLIDRSDAALRRATTMVGLVTLNHLLSAFDALIAARIREARGVELRAVPRQGDRGGIVLVGRVRIR